MSQKTNPTVIGAFVVGAVILAVIGTLSFGGGALLAVKHPYVLYFEGSSLKGLDVGAPVNFRGVRVGSVSDIVVRVHTVDDVIRIPVYIELEPGRVQRVPETAQPDPNARIQQLIDQGMKAQLAMQSFVTGKLAIQLDFHPDAEVRLVGGDAQYPEIPTMPSMMEELTKTIENLPLDELITDLRSAIQGFNELVRSPDLQKTIKDADAMILEFKSLAQNLDVKIDPVLDDVTQTTATLREAVRDAQGNVASAIEALNDTLATYKTLGSNIDAQVDPVAESLKQTLADVRISLGKADGALDAVKAAVAKDSPLYYRLEEALEQAAAAFRSIRILSDYLEQHPDALIKGKGSPGGL